MIYKPDNELENEVSRQDEDDADVTQEVDEVNDDLKDAPDGLKADEVDDIKTYEVKDDIQQQLSEDEIKDDQVQDIIATTKTGW